MCVCTRVRAGASTRSFCFVLFYFVRRLRGGLFLPSQAREESKVVVTPDRLDGRYVGCLLPCRTRSRVPG